MKITNTTEQPINLVHIRRDGKLVKHTPMVLPPGKQSIDNDIAQDLEQQSRWQELIEHGFIQVAK